MLNDWEASGGILSQYDRMPLQDNKLSKMGRAITILAHDINSERVLTGWSIPTASEYLTAHANNKLVASRFQHKLVQARIQSDECVRYAPHKLAPVMWKDRTSLEVMRAEWRGDEGWR